MKKEFEKNKKCWVLIAIVFLGILLFFKFFVHDSCGGNPGIPWWPNSGCLCRGLLLDKPSSEERKTIGRKADYCIGILVED